MNIRKIIIYLASFTIPIFFNQLINLSDGFYFTELQALAVDIMVVFGVIGIITVQTYGTYKLLDKIKPEWIK